MTEILQEQSTEKKPNSKQTILQHQINLLFVQDYLGQIQEELLPVLEGTEDVLVSLQKALLAVEDVFQKSGDLLKTLK